MTLLAGSKQLRRRRRRGVGCLCGRPDANERWQGLTLLHVLARREHFSLCDALSSLGGYGDQLRLKLSRVVEEGKTLNGGTNIAAPIRRAEKMFAEVPRHLGRGLHSFTSQLNLSFFSGIGIARSGCLARVQGVFRV
jgi:hypothetical protein